MNENRHRTCKFVMLLIVTFVIVQISFVSVGIAQDESITQLVSFRINPEKESEAFALLKRLTHAVEEKESGVLAYMVHRSTSDPTLITFFEIYANQAAIINHDKQAHIDKLRQAFKEDVFRAYSSKLMAKIVVLDRISGFSNQITTSR